MSAKKKSAKMVRLVIGLAVVVIGISMVLVWWPDVVSLVRGIIGIAIALAGLLILYMAKD